MDKDLRKSIESIAQAERLSDEEKMSTKNISGIIEVNEDIEDKNELIIKLRRKLRSWRIVFWTGLVVLIILLLYMIYLVVNNKPPEINQVVEDYTLSYKLDCPQLNKDIIKSTTIQGVAHSTAEWSQCIIGDTTYDYIDVPDLAKGFYKIEVDKDPVLAPDDTIYLEDDLNKQFNSQHKTYSVFDGDIEVPYYKDLNKSITKDLDLQFGVFDAPDKDCIYFYNEDTASSSSPVPSDRIASIINPLEYKISVYEGVDIEVIKLAIQGVLSEGTYQDIEDTFAADTFVEDTGVKLIKAIKEVTPKFEIIATSTYYESINESIYNYYDSVTNENGKVICTKDGVEDIPEVILNIDLTDYEILYDKLACAYHFGWY